MSIAVVIVAAGSGTRLGAGSPKALVALRGRTILDWSVRAFTGHDAIDEVVVVAPAESVVGLRADLGGVRVVAGGATRQDSVLRGLALLDVGTDFVLVHDAARPLVPAAVVSRVVEALRSGADAVIPVLPMIDTIKRVDAAGQVTSTLDRTALRRVQTPQGFRLAVLRAANEGATEVTDDAGLVEAYGVPVHTIPGDEISFKITTPHDLHIAELLAAGIETR